MKNSLFKMESVIKGRYTANVGAGAGAETKSFGSITLVTSDIVELSLGRLGKGLPRLNFMRLSIYV